MRALRVGIAIVNLQHQHAMTASILNFAGPDLLIVIVIIVLLFGAKRIPKLARGIRLSILEFRRYSKPSSEAEHRPETKKSIR